VPWVSPEVSAPPWRITPPDARRTITESAMTNQRRVSASPVRDQPTAGAAALGYLDPDRPVPVLGRFNDYLLVRTDSGKVGWLSSALE